MHRISPARAAFAAVVICVPVAVAVAGTAQAAQAASAAVAQTSQQKAAAERPAADRAATRHHAESLNEKVAAYVRRLEGVPYAYGGTTPAGFDCSGLTRYVYGHFGRHIERTSEAQFQEFRPVSHSRARLGDLVFFHVDSDPGSYVYHVGIYEGGDTMVAASSGSGSVIWESFSWAGDTVTFGTITH